MIRAVLLILTLVGAPALAQDFRILTRVDWANSHLIDRPGGAELRLALGQTVPWRVFTLDRPQRVVVEFQEVAWGAVPAGFDASGAVRAAAPAVGRPGWSRLILDLAQPLAVERAGMETDARTGAAVVTLTLRRTDRAAFAAAAAPPERILRPAEPPARDRLHVVLDPGHGGRDPGAQRDGHDEADLTLLFAREFAEVLLRSGRIEVTLTRDADVAVPLARRVWLAQEAGADLFLSLHADAIEEGIAHGATVYTLSDGAGVAARETLGHQHDRADLLGGVDLTGADDDVAAVLLELARVDTDPRSDHLADAIVDGIAAAEGTLHPHPRLEAAFAVLRSADIPSVLIELGFMSSPADLANLLDPAWRAAIQEGLRDAVLTWAEEDAARTAQARR